MVSDMMFICPLVDYDIHVHSRSIQIKIAQNVLNSVCLIRAYHKAAW